MSAFNKLPPSPVVSETSTELADAIRVYAVAFSFTSPDLAGWTTRYRAAFTAADLAARWGLGAATLSSLGPSPSSATTFDNTSGTFNTLVAACATAISACAAPTNGQSALVNLGAQIAAAKTALQEAWGGGSPSTSPSQTTYLAVLASRVWQATALAATLGISWTPGP